MPKGFFPLNSFTGPDGNPLSCGYLVIRLNTDAVAPDGSQIGYSAATRVPLDANGVISGSHLFWANPDLSGPGTYYILRAYTAQGQLVLGPQRVNASGLFAIGFGSSFGSYFGS